MRQLRRRDDQLGAVPGRGLHRDLLVRQATPVAIDQPCHFCRLRFTTPAPFQRRCWVVQDVFVIFEMQRAGNAVGVAVWTAWQADRLFHAANTVLLLLG